MEYKVVKQKGIKSTIRGIFTNKNTALKLARQIASNSLIGESVSVIDETGVVVWGRTATQGGVSSRIRWWK